METLNQSSIFYRQVLAARPAGTNDRSQFELPGVERPECNSKPSKLSSEPSTGHSFFICNLVSNTENGEYSCYVKL
jgi:hypothetical protein